jgi:molybdopterin-guanine dinucleotide biosynthesis protein B
MVMDVNHDHRPYELVSFLTDMDIILVEGFKFEHLPKVEIFRHDLHDRPRFTEDPNLIAVMTDADLDLDIPAFKLDDIKGLGDYLVGYFELPNT